MSVHLDDYHFDLPETLIAQHPANPRDAARLLVYDRITEQIIDTTFSKIDTFLPPQTTLVLNNAKVDKCRLRFGSMEVFVLETITDDSVRALIKPGTRFKLNKTISLTDGIEATVTDIDAEGIRTLVFNCSIDDSRLDKYRLTPLPPYIAQNEQMSSEYQTVYAQRAGSKAAPTAGLHFTPPLLERLKKQHALAEITLDVGLGTFAPLRPESITAGHLHAETFEISATAATILNQASHLTAVGTTSVRTLESAVGVRSSNFGAAITNTHGKRLFEATSGSTEIFIQPGYVFKAVDALITNFHLPKTSLLMMVDAFMGYQPMMKCYAHAINNEYRFYSFGDAMLVI
jgi:S-adenosylmethionine:tRNA ribosyltransferase-isomerase